MKRKAIITAVSIAALYAGIFLYQRYRRRKANERSATLQDALEEIDNL